MTWTCRPSPRVRTRLCIGVALLLLCVIMPLFSRNMPSAWNKRKPMAVSDVEGLANHDLYVPDDPRALNPNGFDVSEVHEFDGFLSSKECDEIIEYARRNDVVQPSKVVCDKDHDCFNEARTSRNGFVKDDALPIAKRVSERVSKILGIHTSHFEDLQVVHYRPGQQYKAHYDACVGDDPQKCDRNVKASGQRYATFIIYLNDDFTGGETEFPKRVGPTAQGGPLRITPKRGKAALFFNLDDALVNVRDDSFHAGLPPTTGEKWMCNKWIRTGPLV